MNLTELSIRRPVSTIMLFVSLVVIGAIAYFKLPLEADPEASIPFIFIHLPYPGSTPEEIERNLLRPVEEAIATLPGIRTMRSRANSDSGSVQVEFDDWKRDVVIAASEARERIDAIRDQLPDDFRRYSVQRWSNSDQPVMNVRLSGAVDLSARADWIETTIKQRLERLPGVARVELDGVAKPEVVIALDKDRLTAHGVALNELVTRLQAANFSVSGGMLTQHAQRLRVQPQGELQSLEDLRNLRINPRGIKLADIAEINIQPQRMDYARLLDGKPSVGVDIYKERSGNLVEISRQVRAQLDELRNDPALRGIEMEVVDDRGQDVVSSLSALAEAGLIGLVLSLIVLYAFLRHWPSTLMVSTAIPICFIMTLGFMYFFGITLNIISMMGLLLAVGMLVDNAVVVVESIYQEREKFPHNPALASMSGTRNVAIALSAGTLCHCVVFLPMLFGEYTIVTVYLAQLAVTISVSLLASWLVAVSLIPMLSARLPTPPALHSPMIRRLQERYASLLRWTLRHRGWSVLGIIVISLLSLWPMLNLQGSYDEGDPARINIFYQWNGSHPLDEIGQEVARVEAFLNMHREEFKIKHIYSRYGERGWGQTRLFLDNDDRVLGKQIEERIRSGLPPSAFATIGVGWPDQGQGIQFSVLGESPELLQELAEGIVPVLARNEHLRDVRVNRDNAENELRVRVNRERAAEYGFTAQDVAQFVGMALRGTALRDFHQGGREIPLNVRFAGSDHYSVEELSGFMLQTAGGTQIPLSALVTVDAGRDAGSVTRLNRQGMLRIDAELAPNVSLQSARTSIETALAAVAFPPGYGYTFAGGGFNINFDGMDQLLGSLYIAVILIFVIMAAVFESLLFPFAIMSCVVFSIFGVFWLLWLTGTEMNIMAVIGILVLMGVVVNNGIVMIEHINHLRRRGMARVDALVEGSRERLRPILMTMGTAILAMIPIALNTKSIGNTVTYYPMARAIAGGLAFSTVVTLLFLPTIYSILDDLRIHTARLLRRARGVGEARADRGADSGSVQPGFSQ